jgi:hypothetical protein
MMRPSAIDLQSALRQSSSDHLAQALGFFLRAAKWQVWTAAAIGACLTILLAAAFGLELTQTRWIKDSDSLVENKRYLVYGAIISQYVTCFGLAWFRARNIRNHVSFLYESSRHQRERHLAIRPSGLPSDHCGWKRTLSASHSGPTPRRAKSDFLLVGIFFVRQMHSAFHDIM